MKGVFCLLLLSCRSCTPYGVMPLCATGGRLVPRKSVSTSISLSRSLTIGINIVLRPSISRSSSSFSSFLSY